MENEDIVLTEKEMIENIKENMISTDDIEG